MLNGNIFLSLVLQFISPAHAEAPDPPDKPLKIQTAPSSAVHAAPDPIADLFPGASGSPHTASPPAAAPKQPTYESWDVLRQYPRYEALPPPSVPEPKAPEPKKDPKEKTDVQ